MNRVLAIAMQTVRAAIRSRVLLSLVFVLLLAVTGLPLTIKGDGTLGGHVQILLDYTLTFAAVIISIAAVWTGCAAISADLEDRTLLLVMAKPVRSWELWVGKWLGLLAINAVLLGLSGAVTYGLLRWTTRPVRISGDDARRLREEILVARARAAPDLGDIDGEARRETERRNAAGEVPAELPVEQYYQALRREILLRAHTVAPNTRREWTFELPFAPEAGRPVFLQFRLAKSSFDIESVAGVWTVGPVGQPPVHRAPGAWRPDAVHNISLPASAFASRTVAVGFENLDPYGLTVVFDPDGGMELLLYGGGFEANLVRALLAAFLRLAFLSALGLTAGALFSLPVASFAAIVMVLLFQLGGYVSEMAGQESYFTDAGMATGAQQVVERFFHLLFRGLDLIVRPLESPDAFGMLATGRRVGWNVAGRMLLAHGLLYSGLLALAGSALFQRRELGRPQ